MINWNEAPADATHAHPRAVTYPWRKVAGDQTEMWYHGRWVAILRAARPEYLPRPHAWAGKGLPPAGTDCEARHPVSAAWRKVKVVHLQNESGCGVCVEKNGRIWWSAEFRPICTPEQIAAAEREGQIDAIRKAAIGQYTQHGISWDAATAIYDAGYRKFEIVDGEA